MPKTLVLAEKPSVAREIAKVIGCRQNADGYISGDKYIVTWALGHLVTLADPEEYDARYKKWEMVDLPILPEKMQLIVIKETSKQFRIVRQLLQRADVSDVIIATDSGREGELVARWILIKAGSRKPFKRLWISSQTTKSIQEGFANLRPGRDYDALYRSAQARAEADWIVGLNISRALTCRFNAQLSAGRVQTPTLALITRREDEIKRFVPQPYYSLRANMPGVSALMRVDGNSRFKDRAEVEAKQKAMAGQTARLIELSKQFKQQSPPAAYDLTELQRDANRRFAYSAKETLSIAQSLYERHKLLTYPRTDSRYLSDDLISTLPERLRAVAIGPYAALAKKLQSSKLNTRYLVDNARVSDHHAIIPTEETPRLLNLSPEERNIYDLVVRRFIAVMMPSFTYEETEMIFQIGKERFYAKGKIVKDVGWKEAYGDKYVGDDNEDHDDQSLPALKQGDSLKVNALVLESGQTKPPARYTEATLLSAMEHPGKEVSDASLRQVLQQSGGLGTPATRADIIEKLFSSFYVERNGKEIRPTGKGIQLVSLVPNELKSAELTAKWEQQLALIGKNQVRDSEFITEMRGFATRLVNQVNVSQAKYVHENLSREKCPNCGKFLLEVRGKRGPMLICSDRNCGYRKATEQRSQARCPNCHKQLSIRGEGESRLYACVCGYRERVSAFEQTARAAGAGKAELQRFLKTEDQGLRNNALAEQLAKIKID